MTLPLSGVKVLDLSRVLAGPLCSMMLGDLGADVIKVERPATGDDTRGWGPPFAADGDSAYFRSVNRNKLSIALDLKDAQDLATCRALIAEADVVIDNFLPGQLALYGLDRGAELSRNRRLVWCTISGFGSDSTRPGYDFVVQAESGWMSITGPVEGPPIKIGVALVDVITGKDAAVAILAGLAGRAERSASARLIDISLAHSATAALVNVAQNVLVSGEDAGRWGNAHPNLVPYQLFDASDRPFVVAVGSDAQWKAAAAALELTDLMDDASLASNAGRVRQRDRVVETIAGRVKSDSAAHWIGRLAAVGVPCGLVRTVAEAIADWPGSAVTGMAPIANGRVRYPSPKLNEHGKMIREKNWSVFDHLPILAQTGL